MSKRRYKEETAVPSDENLQQGGQRVGHHGGQQSGVRPDGKEAAVQGGQHRENARGLDTPPNHDTGQAVRPEPADSDASRRRPLPWEDESKRHRRAIDADGAAALEK